MREPSRVVRRVQALASTLTLALARQRERGQAAAPRIAAGIGLAGLWAARNLWHLTVLLARGLWWLARTLARLAALAFGKGRVALAERLAVQRQLALQRRIAAEEARLVAAEAALLASEQAISEPEFEAAAVAEPVVPPSLVSLEEVLAEGVAALDRGEESLAYHLFAKATEHKAPRGTGEAYADLMKRAWFWRAKTSETVEDVVMSLEHALQLDPGNLQMQAHLAWARQRLERERKLLPIDQPATPSVLGPAPAPRRRLWPSLGTGIRVVGGLMALALAALWMTTGVMPAMGRYLSQLPAGDELLLQRLVLTLNATALPGHGHLPLPVVNYDLGLSLPFIMAFLFVFTARGLMDGDSWARSTGLLFAGVGGWLCAAAVVNPEASHIGLALCVGVIIAAAIGRFESRGVIRPSAGAY